VLLRKGGLAAGLVCWAKTHHDRSLAFSGLGMNPVDAFRRFAVNDQ